MWSLLHDDYGNVTTVTDPDDRTRTAVYNEMNLLESVTNGAGDTVRIGYGPATGNRAGTAMEPAFVVTSIHDGRGNATRFEYDQMYRVTRMTDELGRSHIFAYDGVGRLVRHTLPTEDWVEYRYDAAGSIVRKELSSGETNIYAYDETTGRLSSMSNGTCLTCTLTLSYDSDGFVESTSTRHASGAVDTTLSYEYRSSRSSDSLRRLTYGPGGADTEFIEGYEPGDGWLPAYVSAGDSAGAFSAIALAMTYDNGGRLSGWTPSPAWSSAEFRYNDDDRLSEATYSHSTPPVDKIFAWDYTPGNLSESLDDDGLEDTYSYDAAGRLTSATHGDPSIDDERYTYDRAGNRRIDGQEAEYIYDAANQLLQDQTYVYTYDANGNRKTRDRRTGGALTSYYYDSENRLTRVELPSGDWVRFAYDPLGRLAEKEDNSDGIRRYVYDRDEVLAELDGAGNVVRRYITRHGIDMLVGGHFRREPLHSRHRLTRHGAWFPRHQRRARRVGTSTRLSARLRAAVSHFPTNVRLRAESTRAFRTCTTCARVSMTPILGSSCSAIRFPAMRPRHLTCTPTTVRRTTGIPMGWTQRLRPSALGTSCGNERASRSSRTSPAGLAA